MGIFPLPLTPFELYLRLDDRPEYPMNFSGRFDFVGEMQREAFEAATAELASRHPFAASLIVDDGRAGPQWIARDGVRPWTDWGPIGKPLTFPGTESIDLARGSGIRFWARVGDGRTELTVQSHHCVSDGVGFLHLMGDWFEAYARRVESPTSPPPAVLNAELLRERATFDYNPPRPVTRWEAIRATLQEAFRWFRQRPEPLRGSTTPPPGEPTPTADSDLLTCTIDADVTQRLRRLAHAAGATLNDLVTRDLFLAAGAWNARGATPASSSLFRINIPTDLRTSRHAGMPAANVMGYAFLTRRFDTLAEPDRLLDGIAQETKLIRQWSLGLLFLNGLGFVGKIPGLLRRVLASSRCHATLVHSFLGELRRRLGVRLPESDGRIRIGNLALERLAAAPPIRPNTLAAFGTVLNYGALTLTMRYDRRRLTRRDAEAFLDLQASQLRRTAASAPDAAPSP